MSWGFNGVNSGLSTSDLGVISGYPFSISVWFRPHVDVQSTILALSDSSAAGFFQIQQRTAANGTVIRFRANDGVGNSAAVSASVYTLNEWNHVLCVGHSATDRRIFLNGDSGATNAGSRAFTSSDELNIARQWSTGVASEYFDGNVGPIAIWDRALPDSAAVGLALGQSAMQVESAGLVFYAEMVNSHKDRVGGATISAVGVPTAAGQFSPPMVFDVPQSIPINSLITGTIVSTTQAATSASTGLVISTVTGTMGSTVAACLSSGSGVVTGPTPAKRQSELQRVIARVGTSKTRSSVGGGIGPFGVSL